MMWDSFSGIAPDSLTGSILAVEGIADAAVLLNGPTGCKFYHGAVSERQFQRSDSIDPLHYSEEFYFGQPRVPATYLDNQDYVFGPSEKLEKILPVAAGKGHSLIAVVNSPGASLIGDDLEKFITEAGLSVPCVSLENPGFSTSFGTGFQEAVISVIKRLAPLPKPEVQHSVNLVGISIYNRHWEGSLNELRILLETCGINVASVICAGTTVEELKNLRTARYNLIIHEEYGGKIASFLEDSFGIKKIVPQNGAPIGFDSSSAWIREICTVFGIDDKAAQNTINKGRSRSCAVLSRFNSLTGLPKAATFAVSAESSVAYPLTKWLYTYLGMVPVSIRVSGEKGIYNKPLLEFLLSINLGEVLNRGPDLVAPDVVFADEMTISRLRLRGLKFVGIDICLPGSSHIDVIPKIILGPGGALYLLELILNGLYIQKG